MHITSNNNVFNVCNYVFIGDGSIFDLTKFVLSFFVLLIHYNRLPDWTNPILRMAVPLFFILTSFFFFSNTKGEGKFRLWRFVKRNMCLFLFWSLLLIFPVLYNNHSWYEKFGYVKAIRDILFCDTFKGSWFLMASVQAVTIVYLASRYNLIRLMVGISLIGYLLACATSNYWFLLEPFYFCKRINEMFHHLVGEISLSFIPALLWVSIGYLLSTRYFFLKRICQYSVSTLVFSLIVSLFFLFIEYHTILNGMDKKYLTDDCYIGLIPVSVSVFCILIKLSPFFTIGRIRLYLRRFSTIIYCSHGALLSSLSCILGNGIGLVVGTILLCLLIGGMFITLSNTRYLSILKYSY